MLQQNRTDSSATTIIQLTLRSLNQRHQEVWEQRNDLRSARMSDAVTLRTAMQDLESEQTRQVPVYWRKSLELALEDAARTKQWCDEQPRAHFQTEFSRKGGKASKADALQRFIMERLQCRPQLTEQELLGLLKDNRREFDVNGEEISFDQSNRAQKSVPRTALKDRLHRARKKFNSR
jgi:hypothetical protein